MLLAPALGGIFSALHYAHSSSVDAVSNIEEHFIEVLKVVVPFATAFCASCSSFARYILRTPHSTMHSSSVDVVSNIEALSVLVTCSSCIVITLGPFH